MSRARRKPAAGRRRSRRYRFEPLEDRRMLAAVELLPVADNTLFENSNGDRSNGIGVHFFAGKTNRNSIRRGLVRFDVASEIPAGAEITAVTLELHMSRSRSMASQPVALHRALAEWGEGDSDAVQNEGTGAIAQPGDATWLHRLFDSAFWSQPGGDFVAASSATASVGDVGTYTWSSDQLVADTQQWLDNPASNFGWLLKGNESTTVTATAKRFDTRENTDPSVRPKLTVEFTESNEAPTDITLDNASVAENTDTSGPVLVGRLSAQDADTNDSHAFELVAGAGDDHNARFQVSGNQLQIRAGTVLDHESLEMLKVRIEATDGGGASVQKAFTIAVTDVNEPPVHVETIVTQYTVDGEEFSLVLSENVFQDPDNDDSLTLSATLEDGSALPPWLALDSAQRTFSGTPGPADTAKLTIRLTAMDTGDPSLAAETSFRLFVADHNKPFQNPDDRRDVTGDGQVVPNDVLRLINEINAPTVSDPQSGALPERPVAPDVPPPFFDVTGENALTPRDVLQVINFLNANFEPEGESLDPPFPVWIDDPILVIPQRAETPLDHGAGWWIEYAPLPEFAWVGAP